jgi:hypothetical protein
MQLDCELYASTNFYEQEDTWFSSVTESTPRAMERLEGLAQLKNSIN